MPRPSIVVVGGGPAGSVAALILARAGRRVTLVERGPMAGRPKIGECLPGSARPLLRHLRLLHLFENEAHLPSYGNVSAWGSADLVSTDFIYNPAGLGWHLDRARFDQDLRDEAIRASVQPVEGVVSSVRRTGDGFELSLDRGRNLLASQIVDASGRSSLVARALGARIQRADPLMALYGWVSSVSGDTDTRALIEAVPEGWWYSARLQDGSRVVAFHGDGRTVGRLEREPELWRQQLAETTHIKNALGRRKTGELYCGPAFSQRLESFSGEGWIAVGDAAMAFDPLSSQGIFNALYTGMRGAEALLNAGAGRELYEARLNRIYLAYVDHRQTYYATENRWPESPFWRSITESPADL